MRISLTDSIANGFKQWSEAHPVNRYSRASGPAGESVADLGTLPNDPAARSHHPWLVPGEARI